jgi:hypothetical protein
MMKAKATTEQSKSGQIGQPAACMIPTKSVSPKIGLSIITQLFGLTPSTYVT